MSVEEKAAIEQERISGKKRIEELNAKCVKKGLDFDVEETKYQARLTEEKAKEKSKKAKKKN